MLVEAPEDVAVAGEAPVVVEVEGDVQELQKAPEGAGEAGEC